jgi:hypothetical protein
LELILCRDVAVDVGGVEIFVLEFEGKLVCCCNSGSSPGQSTQKGIRCDTSTQLHGKQYPKKVKMNT